MKAKKYFFLALYVLTLIVFWVFGTLGNQALASETKNLYPVIRGKYGYINQVGEIIVFPKFDYAGDFSEGLAPVKVEGKWGFIDLKGNLTIPPQFEEDVLKHFSSTYGFSEGLAAVKINGKWGFINKLGQLSISAIFDDVEKFSGGVASVKIGQNWGVIDKIGKWVIAPIQNYPINFYQGIATIRINERLIIFVDKTGQVIGNLDNQPTQAKEFYEGLAIIKSFFGGSRVYPAISSDLLGLGKCGYQDERGQVVIKPQFDECEPFTEGLAPVKIGNKWGYIDKLGNWISEPQFDAADKFVEGLALIINDDKLGFIDKTGKIAIQLKFQYPPDQITGKIYYKFMREKIFSPSRFSNGLAAVFDEGKCGYINQKGDFVIQPEFEVCQPFDKAGVAKVMPNRYNLYDGEIYIDKRGTIITKKAVKNILDLYGKNQRLKVTIYASVILCVLWIIAISLHEFGHAIFAYWGGDETIKEKGYLTLNPIKYTHPFLSIIFPVVFFAIGGFPLPGAAVYVDEKRLRNRCWKSAVSAAGPAASLLVTLLIISVLQASLSWNFPHWLSATLAFFSSLQLVFILFNLLPVPPLDGYRIIEPWLPKKIQTQIRKFSLIGLIAVLVLPWFLPQFSLFLFTPAMKMAEKLSISDSLVLDGFELFNRWYCALLLLAVGTIALIQHPQVMWQFLGGVLNLFQKYELAIAAYDKAIQYKSNNSAPWKSKVWTLNRLGRYREALNSLDKALEFEPNNSWMLSEKGCVLNLLGRYQEALIYLDKALDIDLENPVTWRSIASVFIQLNQNEEALICLDKALKFEPKNYWIWENRGRVLKALHRYEEASNSYEKIIKLYPNNAWIWNQRGWLLAESLQQYEEAIQYFDKAIQINPSFYDAWNGRGWALNSLGRSEEAVIAYNKAIQIEPNYYLPYHNRGSALMALQRYEEAFHSYDKALKIDPNHYYAWYGWYGRGWALFNLERYEEAINSCDKAIQIKPDHAQAWRCRSFALSSLRRYEEAFAALDKVVQIRPEFVDWHNRGWILMNLQRYEEAISSFDKEIELNFYLKGAWYGRGLALHNLQHYDDAIAAFSKAIELDSDNDTAWYRRACSYALKGNVELALENLQYAIELNSSEWQEAAKADPNFEGIRENFRFKQLINADAQQIE